jgi:membrane protease YdiL (CAAX protease family)
MACLWAVWFGVAIVGFALTSHRASWLWWRSGCLALAGVALCGSWLGLEHPFRTIFGKPRLSRLTVRVAIVAGFGLLAGIGYRALLQEPLFPPSLHWFVLVAMGVGAMEELLWRGWMQGTLSDVLGPVAAVLIAAGSHAAYKTCLFLFPPVDVPAQNFGGLFLIGSLTFVFGSLLGFFRARQGTIIGPMAFHVVFDLIVYGSYATAPWWVF